MLTGVGFRGVSAPPLVPVHCVHLTRSIRDRVGQIGLLVAAHLSAWALFPSPDTCYLVILKAVGTKHSVGALVETLFGAGPLLPEFEVLHQDTGCVIIVCINGIVLRLEILTLLCWF